MKKQPQHPHHLLVLILLLLMLVGYSTLGPVSTGIRDRSRVQLEMQETYLSI